MGRGTPPLHTPLPSAPAAPRLGSRLRCSASPNPLTSPKLAVIRIDAVINYATNYVYCCIIDIGSTTQQKDCDASCENCQLSLSVQGSCVTQPVVTDIQLPSCAPSSSSVPCICMADASVQTSLHLSAETPRKKTLRRKVHTLTVGDWRKKRRLKALKKNLFLLRKQYSHERLQRHSIKGIVKGASRFLSGDCLKFFEMQLKTSKQFQSPKGRRYSDDSKRLALELYSQGPKAYRFLSRLFSLPCKSTLSLWLQSMQVTPGFTDCDLFKAIECKVKGLSDRDRICALLIDEMAVKSSLHYDTLNDTVVGYEDCGPCLQRKKEIVTNALVFMVRGLALNWKQPVGFVLTHNACRGDLLKKLLFECLDKMNDVGLDVKVVISDQGTNFQNVTLSLGVTAENPHFEHAGKKYYYMFDTPHLLKSVRNNLFKYSITFGDSKVANWKDISNFFAVDRTQRFRLAPKLTSTHLELPAFSKMKVKTAAQVLSRSVAAALETHAQLCGSGCSETAEFVQYINDLFDAMNSSTLHDCNARKCALTVKSPLPGFLKSSLEWFKTVRVKTDSGKDVTSTIKCLNGWRISISAVLHLWDDLQSIYNFHFLFTRRLNQDPLENFFSVIRQAGGKCDNPTPINFCRLFKQLCCRELLKPTCSANCELDVSSVLTTVASGSHQHSVSVTPLHRQSAQFASVTSYFPHSLSCFSCLEVNSVHYVCGFLLRKLNLWHECACMLTLQEVEAELDSTTVYVRLRSYVSTQSGGLLNASGCFRDYVSDCEAVFQRAFDERSHERGILTLIVAELTKIPIPVHCDKFPKLKLLRLFARMRMYYTLKFRNRDFANECSKSKSVKKPRNKRSWQN